MDSLDKWRILNEIAITNDPDLIMQGVPTLPSIIENIWGHSHVPPYIPSTETKLIGNGIKQKEDQEEIEEKEPDSTAPSSLNGGLVSKKLTFEELVKKWREEKPRRKMPNFFSNKPLGNRGIQDIKDSLFNKKPEMPGGIPTISHGVPVGYDY